MNYNNVEVEILINGNSVAKHLKDGKTYIEAKDGSEYEIKIKNNTSNRILVIGSVDGLNVLTGDAASLEDSGYVINAYDSYRIKGFRYSDDTVGAFKFTKKDNSYAAGKSDEAKLNCGVIGVRVFEEKSVTPIWITTTVPQWYRNDDYGYRRSLIDPWAGIIGSSGGTSCNNAGASLKNTSLYSGEIKDGYADTTLNFMSVSNSSTADFDMGSEWGSAKESKVTSTSFERGNNLFNCDIFYASRDSLIAAGVIKLVKTQVAFPNSFPKYATPPAGWIKR